MKLSPHAKWIAGLLAFAAFACGVASVGGCCITSVRTSVEQGEGSLQADTIGIKAKARLDADVDADGIPMPLSDLGAGD